MDISFVLNKDIIDDLYLRDQDFFSFIKFIKKRLSNFTLFTNHENYEEFVTHCKSNPLLEILVDKFISINFIEKLEESLIDENILNVVSKRTIIVSTSSDLTCESFSKRTGVILMNLNTLKEWELYSEIIQSKSLKVTNDPTYPKDKKLNEFSDFTKYLKNCNSVIIFDKYLFQNKSNQKISKNILPLLDSILKVNKYMELLIVSEFDLMDIKKAHGETLTYLKSKNHNNFTLNFVHHTKAFYPKKFDELHSRFLLSNYLHIRCNDSFNFFRDNGEINKLGDIDIHLNLTHENTFSYYKDLDTIKVYLNKVKNEPKCPSNVLKTIFHLKKTSKLFDEN